VTRAPVTVLESPQLGRRRPDAAPSSPEWNRRSDVISLRLAYREPFPVDALFGFLAERAIPGVEEGDSEHYRRALSLQWGAGVATVSSDGPGALRCALQLDDRRDLTLAVRRLRQLFDLDCDPDAVTEVLTGDRLLGAAVAARPGLRVPGHVDGNELAVRAVLGQQVSVPAARTLAGRLALVHGRALRAPVGSVQREFPTAGVIAGLDVAELPMPGTRGRALISLAGMLANGGLVLDPGSDREAVSSRLLSLPGIGPWTVAYVRMRALGDPDAFMPSDLGVRHGLQRLGFTGGEREATVLADSWRPYRAYALQYLWAALSDPSARRDGEPQQLRRARGHKERVK
jgi:AraC family transcriptional regulator, regulatory protein of adaptative response / DNA-3-methyladenine glycosylase II